MASTNDKARKALQTLATFQELESLMFQIRNKELESVDFNLFPIDKLISDEGVSKRLQFLEANPGKKLPVLSGKEPFSNLEALEGNIENYVGMSMVPTGVIGPLRIIGSSAQGDFFVPLATTEGALVASYHRGAKACLRAGGVTSICLIEGVQRSPVFKFLNIADLGKFMIWVSEQMEVFEKITSSVSRYATLEDFRPNIEGNHLILVFEYHTGDAAGQNMVTFCTEEICKYILENTPVKPVFWFIEGNYSGDKKANAQAFNTVRGKKVTAEILISEEIVNSTLKTSPEMIAEYWRTSTIGSIQSGAIGAQGHYANGLTALFIATGQDVACISEASVGITRLEMTNEGDLYACVTLPNLIVGTVGGGTGLPTQRECLELMDCYGEGKARKFAEICAALVLAGEISIAAALSAGHFSAAHKKFGRKK